MLTFVFAFGMLTGIGSGLFTASVLSLLMFGIGAFLLLVELKIGVSLSS
jgi:hypothetical protein